MSEWHKIETAPTTGCKVILFYLNRNNLPRTVMARWLTDEQAAESDGDDVGLEGGWYECIDNWDDYTEVAIHEGEPSHWMPLPPPPATEEKTMSQWQTCPEPPAPAVAELPALPEPWNTIDGEWCGQNTTYEVFTANQMREYARAAIAADRAARPVLPDTGDRVLHMPSGETWLVAYVRDGRLCACGWPESTVPLIDCVLVKKATFTEQRDLLRSMAETTGSRGEYARAAIAEEVNGPTFRGEPVLPAQAESVAPMSQPNRLVAYSAAAKLRELGYEWNGDAWFAAQPAQAEFHNPWRTSLENCISGDNYLRASEYCDLVEELDELYRLRAAPPAPADRATRPVLTDDAICNLWIRRTNIHDGDLVPQLIDFARAVLAAPTQGSKP